MLLVPASTQLLEAGEPVPPGLVVGAEAARVRPHGVAGTLSTAGQLHRDHPGGGVVQQLPVVADHQDGLGRLADPLLEPDLARHIEEVVRLVEQQHLVGAAEEVLQHQPLLLAPGEGAELAVLHAVEGQPESGRRADVPRDLEVVAAGVGVLRERMRVGHLGRLVVGVHQRPLAGVDLVRRVADPHRRDAEQQVGDGGRVAQTRPDHLAHHAQATRAGHRPGVRLQLTGDDPQQRRLAGAVRTHERDLGALADPERHVVQQHPPVRQLVAHPGDVHVSHDRRFSGIGGNRALGLSDRGRPRPNSAAVPREAS